MKRPRQLDHRVLGYIVAAGFFLMMPGCFMAAVPLPEFNGPVAGFLALLGLPGMVLFVGGIVLGVWIDWYRGQG